MKTPKSELLIIGLLLINISKDKGNIFFSYTLGVLLIVIWMLKWLHYILNK